jgi:hypothetical protein
MEPFSSFENNKQLVYGHLHFTEENSKFLRVPLKLHVISQLLDMSIVGNYSFIQENEKGQQKKKNIKR